MSRNFDDTDDYIGDGSNTLVSALPFTISMWFRPESTTTEGLQVLFYHGGATDSYSAQMQLSTSGPDRKKIRWVSKDNGTLAIAQTTTQVDDNVWYHVAASEISTTSRKILLSGGGKGTNTTSSDMFGSSHDRFSFGAANLSTPSRFYDGDIAHAAVWDIELTDDDIISLANGMCPLRLSADNLIFYMPLGGQSPEPDIVGNNDGTLTSAPTVNEEPPIPFGVIAP